MKPLKNILISALLLSSLAYTANRSEDILYPNTPMDAKKDDSDLYNIRYKAENLGKFSKKLEILYYYSKVKHPMSNIYRNSSKGKMGEVVNDMFSRIYGARVKNDFEIGDISVTLGVDASNFVGKRTQRGLHKNAVGTGMAAVDGTPDFFLGLLEWPWCRTIRRSSAFGTFAAPGTSLRGSSRCSSTCIGTRHRPRAGRRGRAPDRFRSIASGCPAFSWGALRAGV